MPAAIVRHWLYYVMRPLVLPLMTGPRIVLLMEFNSFGTKDPLVDGVTWRSSVSMAPEWWWTADGSAKNSIAYGVTSESS